METDTLCIKGSDLSPLVNIFKEEVDDASLSSYGNVFIFTLERYYFRISSNLLTVVIFSLTGKDRADVRIVSGGGGQGLLGITWGAEGSSNKTIINILEDVCESNDWRLYDMEDEGDEESVDPEKLKQLEKDLDEYDEMMVKYNELIRQGKNQDAERLYDDWCKQHPDKED